MSEKNNKNVDIEATLIVQTINDAIQNCYGVYGFSDKANDKKGFVSQGIVLQRHPDRRLSADIYLVISSDIKITEVLREAQNQLTFVLNKNFPETFKYIDVYADAIVG